MQGSKPTKKSKEPPVQAALSSRVENLCKDGCFGENQDRNKDSRLSQKKRQVAIASLFAMLFLSWFIPFVPALKWDHVNVTRWEKKRGEVHVDIGPKIKGWVKISKISKHVLHAIIASEDGRFYQHFGIDPIEIINSAKLNLKKGKIARGGSTITQQVIKMAFLDRSRSFIRKIREALGAILLETIMSKREILEWYINLVEFGDAVYGIEKASWHYFQTKPQLLSIEQGVHLALVLPSPNGWSVGLRRKNLTEFGHHRFRKILRLMRMSGYLTAAEKTRAMARGNFGSPIKGFRPTVTPDSIDEYEEDIDVIVDDQGDLHIRSVKTGQISQENHENQSFESQRHGSPTQVQSHFQHPDPILKNKEMNPPQEPRKIKEENNGE